MSFINKHELITSMPKKYCMLLFIILYYMGIDTTKCVDVRCLINYFLNKCSGMNGRDIFDLLIT